VRRRLALRPVGSPARQRVDQRGPSEVPGRADRRGSKAGLSVGAPFAGDSLCAPCPTGRVKWLQETHAAMNYPDIAGVTFEETPERLKVVLPVRRQWPYLLVYSVLMLTWLGATVWMLTLLFGVSRGDMSVRFLIVWVIILLIWAYLWYRLGSFVWRWWQYFAATREILLVSPATLIVRRPLSLL